MGIGGAGAQYSLSSAGNVFRFVGFGSLRTYGARRRLYEFIGIRFMGRATASSDVSSHR